MSRVKKIEFSGYGLSDSITSLLETVWRAEAGNAKAPNFARIAKDAKNNVRDALNELEVELLMAEPASKPEPTGVLLPVAA